MRLIDADTAHPGMTVIAREQTNGKGQRGRQWMGMPGDSLMMSVICQPGYQLDQQFLFNAAVTVGIIEHLNALHEGWHLAIKWPNDIIVNDKKAGGILIENVLRGTQWSYGIIGLGLNISQTSWPAELPFATSLKIESGKSFRLQELAEALRAAILKNASTAETLDTVIENYNNWLYRRGSQQTFIAGEYLLEAEIVGVSAAGRLLLRHGDGHLGEYNHGDLRWNWQ